MVDVEVVDVVVSRSIAPSTLSSHVVIRVACVEAVEVDVAEVEVYV